MAESVQANFEGNGRQKSHVIEKPT